MHFDDYTVAKPFGANNSISTSAREDWFKFTDSDTHSSHCLYDTDRIYVIDFDDQGESTFQIPPEILKFNSSTLNQLVSKAGNRLGEVTGDNLVLRLQESVGSQQGKLIIFPHSVVETVLQSLELKSQFTKAEKRTLLQIVCGYTLKDCSAVDGVSYETKRVQVKSILSKSNMKRQLDVCNHTITQLLMAVEQAKKTELKLHQPEKYSISGSHYFPRGTRTHTVINAKSKYLRFIEIGPVDGQTVVVLHGQFLPYFTDSIIRTLHQHNLRLIWPLRNGMLAPQDEMLSFDFHVDQAIQSVELAAILFNDNDQPVKIVALGCAAFYSIVHAEKHNSTAAEYTFIGSPASQARKLISADTLEGDGAVVSNMNSLRADYYTNLACQPLIDESHLRKLLTGAYSSSKPDLSVLNAEFSTKIRSAALKHQFDHSENSIKQDCSFQITPDWLMAKGIKQPMKFIHGASDGINKPGTIKQLANQMNAPFYEVTNAGHFVYHSHFDTCIEYFLKGTSRAEV